MKRNKILTAILGIAILAGIICSGIVIAQGIRTGEVSSHNASSRKERFPEPWDLKKTKLEAFSEISVALSYSNLSILPGDDYYLEYHMDGSCEEPQYEVSSGKFYFQEGPTQAKYRSGFHLFFNPHNLTARYEPYYVTLYVPEKTYFDILDISDDSGNVELEKIQAKDADIRIAYGNLTMDSFSGGTLSIDADSGNLELNKVACDTLKLNNEYGNISGDIFQISGKTAITLDSGTLSLKQLETETLALTNEYGNCSVNEINVKNSNISMDSGNLDFGQAVLGTTKIKSCYGDVTLFLSDSAANYDYNLHTEYGTVKLDGNKIREDDNGEVHYQKDNGKAGSISIECESGNVTIN
ncbi:DUF4097 family beta strand repeat-containing protein [Lachnospiraceae bacterium 45-W7]